METSKFPLEELSISQLYCCDRAVTYEIPIYQRNYAWEEEQIRMLVQDIFNAYNANKQTYYIGTLVTFDEGGRTYEVIDGQQRLTTIYIILKALKQGGIIKSQLSYRARKKSKTTLLHLGETMEETDVEHGIAKGFEYANNAIQDIVVEQIAEFAQYFLDNVHIIHYRVPKDVDLNHYFEVMNSRGEQLEMHEIVKAKMCGVLYSEKELYSEKDKKQSQIDVSKFNRIWEACSNMNLYIQQTYKEKSVFGEDLSQYPNYDFDKLPIINDNSPKGEMTIADLLNADDTDKLIDDNKEDDEQFEPIIDFSNFLLIVLKITRINESNFNYINFALDDKALISEFSDSKITLNKSFVKSFAMNLLKAKYLLDNYIVHHANDSEQEGTNPWQLECYFLRDGKGDTRITAGEDKKEIQKELVQLLSMFEVTFSAHQRKNYLFYCLLFLFGNREPQTYLEFLRRLADKYFYDVYLNPKFLNETNNRPNPNSFDQVILKDNCLYTEIVNTTPNFIAVYGDGTEICKGIQLYVFNYTDYRLWKKYVDEVRGCGDKEDQIDRKMFFEEVLGCRDFGLDSFNKFYFSRTRKSLEHFYPQANAGENKALNAAQINCFGNFAMIGSDANSRGSNWYPVAKIDFYKDRKFDQVSVASLKLRIMMQICKDNKDAHRENNEEWNFDDICKHQTKMLSILFDRDNLIEEL